MLAFCLLADSELADYVAVAIRIVCLQVIQQAAAFAYQHQQASPGGVVLRVSLEMLGQFANPLAQNRDLDLRRTGVRIMGAEALNQISFLGSRQHGVCYSSVVSVHFSSVYCETNMNVLTQGIPR